MAEKESFLFSPGDEVTKIGGDYTFEGVVVAAFHKESGKARFVVENRDRILHIFSAKNLILSSFAAEARQMALLSDGEIRDLCLLHDLPMIEPYAEFFPYNDKELPSGVISYGITSGGYDVRLCPSKVMIFKNTFGAMVNPKRFKEETYQRDMFDVLENLENGFEIVIPPNGYILAQTLEYIRIPRNVKGRCVGKSTLARSGILINTTPMEPGWEGRLTLEIANLTGSYAVVFAGEGIAQFEFDVLSRPPLVSYKEKGGKYQGQQSVTVAKVL